MRDFPHCNQCPIPMRMKQAHCSESSNTPEKPNSSANTTVENANFVSKLKDINGLKFQRVKESRFDKTKESEVPKG